MSLVQTGKLGSMAPADDDEHCYIIIRPAALIDTISYLSAVIMYQNDAQAIFLHKQ